MSLQQDDGPDERSRNSRFTTTQWSLVIAAGGDIEEARGALAALCGRYWYPLYAYVRRKGFDVDSAQDFVQGFFVQLIEKNYIKSARRERGKFRSFLLTSLKNYMANEWDRTRAQKRGGGRVPLSLDFELAEGRYARDLSDDLTPDRVFERKWAVALLDQALSNLRDEYATKGKEDLFERLRSHLTNEGAGTPYRDLAERLNMSEGAIKVAAHRLRKRYGEIVREEIAQTLADPEEIEDEIRYLFSVFS